MILCFDQFHNSFSFHLPKLILIDLQQPATLSHSNFSVIKIGLYKQKLSSAIFRSIKIVVSYTLKSKIC